MSNKDIDKELVAKVLGGDNQAFKAIVKDNQRLVFSIVYRMLGNSPDRDDVCQDTFIRVHNKLSAFRFQSKLSTWIARVAYTTCLNHLQKRKTELLGDVFPSFSSDDNHDEIKPEEMIEDKNTGTIVEKLERKELLNLLDREIEKLPPLLQTIVVLFHKEEIDYNGIAEITELPMGTVKSYLFRARQILKVNMLKNFKKEDLL